MKKSHKKWRTLSNSLNIDQFLYELFSYYLFFLNKMLFQLWNRKFQIQIALTVALSRCQRHKRTTTRRKIIQVFFPHHIISCFVVQSIILMVVISSLVSSPAVPEKVYNLNAKIIRTNFDLREDYAFHFYRFKMIEWIQLDSAWFPSSQDLRFKVQYLIGPFFRGWSLKLTKLRKLHKM